MKLVAHFFCRNVVRLVAIAFVVALYLLAQQPRLSTAERTALAANFRFSRSSLYEVPAASYRSRRVVNPSLERIASWVSATGAAVALNDLDGMAFNDGERHPRTDACRGPASTNVDTNFCATRGLFTQRDGLRWRLPGDLRRWAWHLRTYWDVSIAGFPESRMEKKASSRTKLQIARIIGAWKEVTGAADAGYLYVMAFRHCHGNRQGRRYTRRSHRPARNSAFQSRLTSRQSRCFFGKTPLP